ncbi:hypothetical protein ACQ33O_10390 [Ferruginibacter sp. SUN002]|uniref:hypothetical protein n=1 Tax=Ferruginibacter sp. SUN002 TaxID=2937789 RepID=UPI003D36A6BB
MKKFIVLIIIPFLFSCSINSNEDKNKEENKIEKPIVVKKRFLARPNYKMEYPDNWTIDSTDSDYDIDTYFSLNSPSNGAFASFMFINTKVDEQEHLDLHIKEQLKVTMKNGTVSYFEKWGDYIGHGATIRGKLLGIFKGDLKIFVHSNDTSSFLILSQLSDEDKLKDEEGLKLIESSFRTK